MTAPARKMSWPSSALPVLIALAVALGAIAMLGYLLIDRVPEGASTHAHATRLSYILLAYAREHNQAPASLDELASANPSAKHWIKDEWGRPFLYAVEPDSVVALSSRGRDGKSGSERANLGLAWRLHLKNPHGDWIDQKNETDLDHWFADLPRAQH